MNGLAPEASIESGELELDGSDQPALVFVERLEARSALEIQRTDVTVLRDLVLLVLVEHAQRQPLRPADRRTIGIDPTGALCVEERTASFGMRLPLLEQRAMLTLDPRGLDGGDAQAIETAGAATEAATQPGAVTLDEPASLAIDLGMQRAQRLERLLARMSAPLPLLVIE